ncbi:MAG: hypothetical protein ACYDHU_07480 [Acidimicrobiales bacterium]
MVLGGLWLLDAALQARSAAFSPLYPTRTLAQSAMGAPSWERHVILAGIHPFAAHWTWWNLAAVLLQFAIGLALVSGRWVRTALCASFIWAMVVWLFGEGLGMIPTGFALMAAGAPGPAALLVAAGGLAWPRPGRPDVSRLAWKNVWAALWGGEVVLSLPWVYPSKEVLTSNLAESAQGQPGPLAHLTDGAARLVAAEPVLVVVLMAVVQLAVISGCLLDQRHLRSWLGLAVAVTAVYWVVGQCLGGMLAATGTDPGTAPLVVVLALAAWPGRAHAGTGIPAQPEFGSERRPASTALT